MTTRRLYRENIVSINTDGRLTTFLSLQSTIITNRPLAILIQDLPMGIEQLTRPIATGYELVKSSTQQSNMSNKTVGILVDTSRLKIIAIHEPADPGAELESNSSKTHVLAASVEYKDIAAAGTSTATNSSKNRMILFSVYIRPRASHSQTEQTLKWISNTARQNEGISRSLIMGDFNATHTMWAPAAETLNNNENSEKHYRMIKETRGRAIAKAIKNMKMNCLNRTCLGPTFESPQLTAYIDLVISGNKIVRKWNRLTIESLGENINHKLLRLTASTGAVETRSRTRTIKIIKTEHLNSDQFIEANTRSKSLIVNWKQLPRETIMKRLDKLMNIIYKCIKEAQNSITVTKQRNVHNPKYKIGQCNARTRRRINKLKEYESKLEGVEMRKCTLPQQKRQRYKLRKMKQKLIKAINAESASGIDRDKDLWEKRKAGESMIETEQDLTETNISSINTQQDIDTLADTKFPTRTRTMSQYTERALTLRQLQPLEINREEIEASINELRLKKYTSPEGIKMQVFFHSIKHIKEIIQTIAEMSFHTAYIPKLCRITQGTLIPKKAAGQFRIVHVSSPMAALLELIALKRLQYRLEIGNLESPYQFGFTATKDRHDMIARILELALRHRMDKRTNGPTYIIGLDIQGAFDNVDQDELILKLDKNMGHNQLKYWLTEFILNRNIIIKTGKLKSKEKPVCTGVPQGSALGPILWNYMINDIEKGLTVTGTTEILKYADDIMIIHNSNNRDRQDIQDCLNELIKRIKKLKLDVRPDKCNTLIVQTRCQSVYNISSPKFTVNGEEIPTTETLSILGLPITSRLKLDTKWPEHRAKLGQAIKKLHELGKLELINSAQEWRILFDSLIQSRTTANYWPILLIDATARKWIDDTITKAIRIVHEWPKNISDKLIRLITRNHESGTIVRRLAEKRATAMTPLSRTYKFLLLSSTPTGTRQLAGDRHNLNNRLANLEHSNQPFRRRHPNPEKILKSNRCDDIIDCMERTGPIWTILDRNQGSMIIEMYMERVLQNRLGKHKEYPTSYFNSFSLLLETVSDRSIMNRTLIVNENNSILMAIENLSNHDWRVIKLRETLVDNGWQVLKIKTETDKQLNHYINETYKRLNIRNSPNANDFTAWQLLMENGTEDDHLATATTTDNNNSNNNATPTTQVKQLNEPYLLDYKQRNRINQISKIEDKRIYLTMHTRMTKTICPTPEIWQNITPNWLDGQKMLMLSGLISTPQGQLERGDRSPASGCELCTNQPINDLNHNLDPTRITWPNHGLDDNTIRGHITLHRAIECPAFAELRNKFINKLRESHHEGDNTIKRLLKNRMKGQTVLRYLAKCAMNKH